VKLSNIPPKGFYDWSPDEFAIRKFIFETWRDVCQRYGYNEYLTPILENSAIYKAKSGEDVGIRELMTLTDSSGRELAIRPEMTPSVTRFVTRIFNNTNKPIRLFSIANFVRNEKPQKGRNREFWQLNLDIFGSASIYADIEIIQISIEILKAFNAPPSSFVVKINHRKLIEHILIESIKVKKSSLNKVVRILDKYAKISKEKFIDLLKSQDLDQSQITLLLKFISCKSIAELEKIFKTIKDQLYTKELKEMFSLLEVLGYKEYIQFEPGIIRGFDYYDGVIFEVFDTNPSNTRSLFGGGRYNGLAGIFGYDQIPAVGCAPGDETTKIFLDNWKLIPGKLTMEKTFVPILPQVNPSLFFIVAQALRKEGRVVVLGENTQPLGKALKYANKCGYDFFVILGTEELQKGVFILKNMKSGEQKSFSLSTIL
jgi:histidyl-tRNA synthetase